MNREDNTARTILLQDVGMLLFLVGLFTGCLITAVSSQALLVENIIMLMGLFLCTLLTVFRVSYTAIVVAGFEIIAYAAYKLYYYFAYSTQVSVLTWLWAPATVLCVLGLSIFMAEFSGVEGINLMLHSQVEELTVIDPLTGLENLKSLYSNLSRTMALARRKDVDVSLLVVKLRYADELKKILSRRSFNMLRQKIGEIAENELRLEDRVYAIDSDGSIAAMCYCDKPGAATVKKRLLGAFAEKDAFEGIADSALRVEMRIAFVEYDPAKITNAMEFKQLVDGELQYDV